MKMRLSSKEIDRVGKFVLLACLSSTALGLSTDPPPVGSLVFTVTNGNCSSATNSVSAGRVAITVTLSSSSPQSISLVTTDASPKHLLEHTQVGSSETWSTLLTMPAGSYQLINSVGTSKCAVTVN